MDAIRDDIEILVGKERREANRRFPLFNSVHEGFAVIMEECNEAEDECNFLGECLNRLWNDVRTDTKNPRTVEKVRSRAINLAVEAIQIAAMAEKYRQSFGNMEEKDHETNVQTGVEST